MSEQKIKIRKSKHSQTYSKNPIINSLIRHKLESEIQNVKHSTNQIIQRQLNSQNNNKQSQNYHKQSQSSNKQPQSNSKQPQSNKKMVRSLSSLHSLKVTDYTHFDPLSSLQSLHLLNFIQRRQIQTPLIEPETLKHINKARKTPQLLEVKLNNWDKFRYQSIKNYQDLQKKEIEARKTINQIQQILWLPSQPQVRWTIEKATQFTKQHEKDRPVSSLQVLGSTKIGQYLYNTKKYHKDDYLNLNSFLRESLNSLNLHNLDPSDSFSKSYAIYITTWKEFIRLTYIQSTQKGLLLQCIVWSFIRLVRRIIDHQHTINYQQFKDHSSEQKQNRQMYETRITHLQSVIEALNKQRQNYKKSQAKLVRSYLTYQKMNRQLVEQLEVSSKKLNKYQHELSYVNNKYHKLLNELVDNDIIYSANTKLYIINKYMQPQILLNLIETTLTPIQQPKNYTEHFQNLQNQLNRFWQKTSDDLDFKQAYQKMTYQGSQHIGVSTEHFTTADQGVETEVTNGKQIDLQAYLEQKIMEQRQYWVGKSKQSEHLYLSLQQLYTETFNQVTRLSLQKNSMEEYINELKKKLSQIQQRLTKQTAQKYLMAEKMTDKINKLTKINLQYQKQIGNLKEEVLILTNNNIQLERLLKMQKQNVELMVRKNIDGDLKLKSTEKERQSLMTKIKSVSPWFQKFIQAVDLITQHPCLELFQEVSAKIQQNFGDYVQRDVSLFNLTK